MILNFMYHRTNIRKGIVEGVFFGLSNASTTPG